jgi:hypothetical protein
MYKGILYQTNEWKKAVLNYALHANEIRRVVHTGYE